MGEDAIRGRVHCRRLICTALMKTVTSTCLLLLVCGVARGAAPAAVLQELRSFDQMGSVLYVAAHPDDENTQLIAYLRAGGTIGRRICR